MAARILAPNPGPMTLDGTNTWLLDQGIVVDPGPLIESHVDAICDRDVQLVLVTHHHADHTEAVDEVHARTGAPVRALSPEWCRDAPVLTDGEELPGGVRVLTTPGHTADSVSFLTSEGIVTGDTVLGRGTTVIMDPDGDLGAFLHSLDRLERLGGMPVLPAHGDGLSSIERIAREYRDHRLARLEQVREALADADVTADAPDALEAVVQAVYADVDTRLRPAVEATVRAQLAYLRVRG